MLRSVLVLVAAACVVTATEEVQLASPACHFGDLSTQAAFTEAARARTSAHELILFNVNAGYARLAVRMAGNLAHLGRQNYLAISDAEGVCRLLVAHGVCCGHTSFLRDDPGLDAWQMGPGGGFADRRDKTVLFALKLQTLVWAADAGARHIIHLDLDIALMSDPFGLVYHEAFRRAALATAADTTGTSAEQSHECEASPTVTQLATGSWGRPRLNTGVMYVAARSAALQLVNNTLNTSLQRLNDAVLNPPPACSTCFFPSLPDWDLVWEQAVLNAEVQAHTPPEWNVSCVDVNGTTQRVAFAWSHIDGNVSSPCAGDGDGFDAERERVVALPEWAVGRVCVLNATLAQGPRAKVARHAPLLDVWPKKATLVAGHVVFTPPAARLQAMRAAGWWRHANGTRAGGNRDGAACFERDGEPVVLLSMSSPHATTLALCTEQPREDGEPCCIELEPHRWPWPVDGLPPDGSTYADEIRRTFPGCQAWEWKRSSKG